MASLSLSLPVLEMKLDLGCLARVEAQTIVAQQQRKLVRRERRLEGRGGEKSFLSFWVYWYVYDQAAHMGNLRT